MRAGNEGKQAGGNGAESKEGREYEVVAFRLLDKLFFSLL